MNDRARTRVGRVACALALAVAAFARDGSAAEEPLRVCATTPDLASLAETIGGDAVEVISFAKGPQDGHYVEPRPSFVRTLHNADVYLRVGLQFEQAWSPALVRAARNAKVLRGGAGDVDASTVIATLERPTADVDRSMGDIHVLGNPHYFLDPLNGLDVARLLRDRFAELRPEARSGFESRYEAFRRDLLARLFGTELLAAYPAASVPKLVTLLRKGGLRKFLTFLAGQGQSGLLGGWLGELAPHAGTAVVADHNLWPYFARRFGIEVVGFLEPKPGIAPTTRHLGELVATMGSGHVALILTSSYFDPRHARFLAEHTGARIVNMAHQTGARDGTSTYLEMVAFNVRSLARALEEKR